MSKLHALLIGINKYHDQSGVSHLEGCERDVEFMQRFIGKHYADVLTPSIATLINDEATRENIIKTFQSHLIDNAKPGDTVLFYYSGHGSTSKSAEAFEHLDPKKQDETLVCYDSRLDGHYDLTDKEIAVLLSRIADDVHILVIADSCHSASVTRSTVTKLNLGKKRFTNARETEERRSLNSYLLEGDNYYANFIDKGQKIVIPHSKHLLLSACDRDEEALETQARRGLFSTQLINILYQNKDITYADLFVKIRQSIQAITKDQTPTIAPLEGFNPNTVFLRKDVKKNHHRHAIFFKDGAWRLDYGAIHGLPSDKASVEKLLVGIYADIDDKEQLKAVKVKRVLLKESTLDFDESDHNKQFSGELQTMANPLLVRLNGTKGAIQAFKKHYNKKPSPYLLFDEETDGLDYSLNIENDKLVIKTQSGELVHGIKETGAVSIHYITDMLERIEEWGRLASLENKETKITEAIEMVFMETNDIDNPIKLKGADITLEVPKVGEDKDENGEPITNWFEIKAINTSSKKYYATLFHLSADYQVKTLFSCQELPPKSDEITLDNAHGLYIASDKWDEVTDVFKLIVSTESFDDYKFQQGGFERGVVVEISQATKGLKRSLRTRKKAEADWFTQTITVNTIRTQNTIGENDISFEKEKLTIKGHPSFKAEVSFAPLKSGAKSVHPQAALATIFREEGLELLSLSGGKTRGIQDNTMIRLGELDAKQEGALKEQPLEVIVKQETAPNEQIISVTYDGEFVIPFGTSTKEEDGTTKISIDHLPDVKDIHTTRSPKKALWFCLLKVAGFRNKAFRLRLAELNNEGELIRHTRAIQSKVDKAKKILIVAHGIIGDTKDMAHKLQFLVDDGHYDLMLAYDYENLNEPIESIAKEFNKLLTDLGLHADDGKQLDIIAHSMGGLVSRYMMETIRKGDSLVDRLIMLGTPNGGSVVGNVPEYIKMLTTLLTVAVNFGKSFIGPAIAYLEGLNKVLGASEYLTVTLNQMNEDNEFIKNLYKNKKTSAKYYIIAGDITNYESEEAKTFNRFKENVLLKIGNTINQNFPNDIAVSCDQIKAVPPAFITNEVQVSCHHLNYFISEEAMAELRKIYV